MLNTLFSKIFFYSFLAITILSCKDTKKQKEEHKFTNSLITETSPYLLQHAHNPVNWHAWSNTALENAKKEDKLVLVSIGYSSCHWCHVMEKESFEDEEVAKIMNANFVNIKVDREERPDVDQVYMTALQLIKGSGGWPLNVITLPNGKPIYGGTYHSKEEWIKVLEKISTLYKNDPKKANQYADMVSQGIQEANLITPSSGYESLTKKVANESVENWKNVWDTKKGGDQSQEKFMLPSNLNFLLDYAILTGDKEVENHIKNTLNKIAFGGIYDFVGGGFYRYSTDPNWKVPHFEKMLYDNAQLLSVFSKAYGAFKEPIYKEVVYKTIEYLERDMKNPNGGYYAAMDADSEGEEGKYYVWKKEELENTLGEEFAEFKSYFNITSENIWEHKNYVLHRGITDAEFCTKNKMANSKLQESKELWKKLLLTERGKRIPPRLDDKIITSWNALLITGFTDAYNAFGDSSFLDMATKGITNLLNNSLKNNELRHSYKVNSKQVKGFLEDYTFLVDASINLYSATLDTKYLDLANSLNSKAMTSFSDDSSGMYRFNENKDLIAQIIKTNDGVIPSPNAVMAQNLLRLGHLNYDKKFLDKSKSMVSAMVPMITPNASSYARWNSVLLNTTYTYYEIAVVGAKAKPLVKKLHNKYIPNTLLVGSTEDSKLPLFEGRYVPDGTYIYVCRDNSCKLPVETAEAAVKQLNGF
ncbi:thioredoxin domain-containing protein [uncultured Maribacter sp.]|uniref:thioredoxin domain-containing protein n=1 Tax=uncultured Maribacter sp. TaxID=431308 RepID=UPI00262189D9|nr:thioredoxin domain-containing protein [uncultured Maribacter sp.]